MNRRLLAFFGLLLLAASPTRAQFSYAVVNGSSVIITHYTGANPVVTVPSVIDNLPVVSIGGVSFSNCTILTSVTMPGSVTSIGVQAFQYCVNLANVTFSGSITNIGNSAFQFCGSLPHVTIPGSVTTIGPYAFNGCSNLTTVAIPPSVTSIGVQAFSSPGLTAITVDAQNSFYSSVNGVLMDISQTTLVQYPGGVAGNYTIPGNVTFIAQAAFASCEGLTGVTIPDNVTTIGANAFNGCSNLVTVAIPLNVASIGVQAFSSLGLTAITVDAQNPFYSSLNGVLMDKSQTTLVQYPGGLAGNFTVPGGVTTIAPYAFASCSNLATVIIPGTVTNLGVRAFADCVSLTGVYMTGNAPTVGSALFTGDSVTAYYLPGTTGWSSIFAFSPDIPAVLWNPVIQGAGVNFGVSNYQFGFNITGTNNYMVVVEACTNLANPVWTPLATNTLTNGSFHFSEPLQPGDSARFYGLGLP